MRLLHPGGHPLGRWGCCRDDPDPDEQAIRAGIEGNLCRCTGYHNIVKAVRSAAKKLAAAPTGRAHPGPGPIGGMRWRRRRSSAWWARPSGGERTPVHHRARHVHRRHQASGNAARVLRPQLAGPRAHRQRRRLARDGSLRRARGVHREGPGRRRRQRHPGGVAAPGHEDRRLPRHRRGPRALHRRGGRGGGGRVPAIARDAAELVQVDYEELPAVVDARRRPPAGALRGCTTPRPTTAASTGRSATRRRPTRRFAGQRRWSGQHLVNQRLIANAIEPRASLAQLRPRAPMSSPSGSPRRTRTSTA